MSYVAIRNLTKRYDGALALSGIDLEFHKGEFVIIVGPSGCGKSTLLRMIAGLEDITGGEIALDGERVNELDPVDRGCAMVFQNYALYPHMTVAQNIAYPLRLAGVPKKLRAERARVVAESLGLTPYLDRLPRQLSGGQRQRVAMGRAIVREPKLFLFDEPLSNLDAKMRMQMRVELRRLHRRLAATSILVTHDQIEAMTMADRLVVMNGGRIEQVGAPSEVYDRPASLFVAGFLGSPAMNLIPARIDESGAVATEAAPGVALRGALPLARGLEFTLGVRPEDFAVVAPDRGGLPAVVDMIEDLGGVKVAHCQLGDRFATAMLGRNHGLREGERVALQPDWSRIHAFETASGRRIDLPVGSPGAIAVA